jgi:hypothetical protein
LRRVLARIVKGVVMVVLVQATISRTCRTSAGDTAAASCRLSLVSGVEVELD